MNDWSSTHNWDYWNINFTSAASVNNNGIIKTIYDPSPTDFALPKTAAFTGFTTTGDNTTNPAQYNVSNSFNKGWNIYTDENKNNTISFISFGIRDVFSGRIGNGDVVLVGEEGDYWTAGASSTLEGRRLYFYSGCMQPQQTGGRSFGFSIRSVTE